MEVKKGDKSMSIPGWVLAAGVVTLGAMVTDICKVAISKHKQFQGRDLTEKILGWVSSFYIYCVYKISELCEENL